MVNYTMNATLGNCERISTAQGLQSVMKKMEISSTGLKLLTNFLVHVIDSSNISSLLLNKSGVDGWLLLSLMRYCRGIAPKIIAK